jgi:hypothetical protein
MHLWTVDASADWPPQLQAIQIQLHNTLLTILQSETNDQLRFALDRLLEHNMSDKLKEALAESSNEALVQLALVRHVIIVAAIKNDSILLWQSLKLIAQFSVDLALAALNDISEMWTFDTEHMSCLAEAYVQIIEHSDSAEVRAKATIDLTDLLDQTFDGTDVTKGILWQIDHIPVLLQQGVQSPNLTNAQLRISGWCLLKEIIFETSSSVSPRLEAWGHMLSDAGNAYNVSELFDVLHFHH